MVILLNRGDYTLLTSDSEYYPRNSKSKTLAWIDGDDKVCFYLQDDDETEEGENEKEEREDEPPEA